MNGQENEIKVGALHQLMDAEFVVGQILDFNKRVIMDQIKIPLTTNQEMFTEFALPVIMNGTRKMIKITFQVK